MLESDAPVLLQSLREERRAKALVVEPRFDHLLCA